MNISKNLILVSTLLLWCGTVAIAQDRDIVDQRGEQVEGHYKPMPLSPEKKARRTVVRMDSLLGLTEKQYEKLYALHLKEERRRAESDRAVSRPRMGNGPDGAPRMHPGGGNPPSHGFGNRPGGNGNRLPEGFGQRPPHDFAAPADASEREKQRIQEEQRQKKIRKKIRKILTEEQYARWQEEQMRPMMRPENGEPERRPDHGFQENQPVE